MLRVVSAVILLFLSSCQSNDIKLADYFKYDEAGMKTAGVQMIPIHTPKGTFKVWTKRIGNNPRIKILILHGGPALTHEYMECFESYFPKEGFEFYEYDQLGSYYSDQPTDTSLWTLERFVEEVEQVRIALKLSKDNFYLLGNSWGGILGMEYALKYQQNLKGLIVSNMTADYAKYGAYNAKLRSEMRQSLLDSLAAFEKVGDYANPIYQQLVFDEYYCQHILRRPTSEWPEPVLRSFKHINQPVYEILQGPSEFLPGGRLVGWECWSRLNQLAVPTLMIGSRYDTMNPEEMEQMSRLVKHGEYLFCPNGSHLSMWDAQEEYYPGIIKFIRSVDAGRY